MSTVQPDHSTLAWGEELRARGRRVTRQRLVVLEAAHEQPHQGAESIWFHARTQLPDLTLQSVYTILGDLTELDLLRKIEPDSGPARYETRVGDNHHHAICERCGLVEDVECVVGEAPCLEPSSTSITVRRADVTFFGLCQNCLNSQGTLISDPASRPIP
ncbi:Fur family transcriptional regulator [Psychromicrobium xiongbiense]|uniref:Fur family transcriptional regulator n=1 Tax=Psychromicrobium xiongbiense TaxID=3051184 RepID=UPI0025551360|nr:transcriptional repressor [Psychromicrobium sp. YIM S02556]